MDDENEDGNIFLLENKTTLTRQERRCRRRKGRKRDEKIKESDEWSVTIDVKFNDFEKRQITNQFVYKLISESPVTIKAISFGKIAQKHDALLINKMCCHKVLNKTWFFGEGGANNRSPIHYWLMTSHSNAPFAKDFFDWFIESGADINLKDDRGFSPLLRAAAENRLDAFSLLLNRPNINLTYQKGSGESVLTYALCYPSTILTTLLKFVGDHFILWKLDSWFSTIDKPWLLKSPYNWFVQERQKIMFEFADKHIIHFDQEKRYQTICSVSHYWSCIVGISQLIDSYDYSYHDLFIALEKILKKG